MKDGRYTTFARTADGKVYDIGRRQYPPRHDHDGNGTCRGCMVINAGTAHVDDMPGRSKI